MALGRREGAKMEALVVIRNRRYGENEKLPDAELEAALVADDGKESWLGLRDRGQSIELSRIRRSSMFQVLPGVERMTCPG